MAKVNPIWFDTALSLQLAGRFSAFVRAADRLLKSDVLSI